MQKHFAFVSGAAMLSIAAVVVVVMQNSGMLQGNVLPPPATSPTTGGPPSAPLCAPPSWQCGTRGCCIGSQTCDTSTNPEGVCNPPTPPTPPTTTPNPPPPTIPDPPTPDPLCVSKPNTKPIFYDSAVHTYTDADGVEGQKKAEAAAKNDAEKNVGILCDKLEVGPCRSGCSPVPPKGGVRGPTFTHDEKSPKCWEDLIAPGVHAVKCSAFGTCTVSRECLPKKPKP